MYGFEAASEFYFSKPTKKLTIEEAALLAGLPKGPTIYSPINHPDRAQKRRNLVINAMYSKTVRSRRRRRPMPARRR